MTDNTATSRGSKIRPPIVVVLGHVDHGKTTLLDTIRKTKVADKESGGITQHIGAYQTTTGGKIVTFLDTPGHEAFSAIRSRGVKVADVAVLVVAADEGLKPQTKEAIKIIKEEKTPFIVAINKIDKENANTQKVRQELAAEDVLVEDWGGKVPVVEISAKQNKNITELIDLILLVAELEELTEDTTLPVQGLIIESQMDKNRGYVATVLIKKGVLEVGDWFVAGTTTGKVKSMQDFLGKAMVRAVPSQPAIITGWNGAPSIGKVFSSAYSKEEAENIAASNTNLVPLFQFFKDTDQVDANKKYFNVIFKSDVSSSLEAIELALSSIKSEEIVCRVVGYDVGNISESDIRLAVSSKAVIFGFRVGIDEATKRLAEKEGISISSHDVIYELIENVRKQMGLLLEPEVKKNILCKMRILATFKKDTKSQIVGGKVTSGTAKKPALADVTRGSKIIMTGKISHLQHNKEETAEVHEGLEAGIKIEAISGQPFEEIKEGDIVEMYQEEKIIRSL